MFEMQTKQESTTQLKKSPNNKAAMEKSHTSSFMMNPVSVANMQNKMTAKPVTGHLSEGIVQRDLKSVPQKGPTCGLHALVTVLYDMVPDIFPDVGPKGTQGEIDKAKIQKMVKEVKDITFDNKHYTILGEAFDAQILCKVGKKICEDNEIDNISLEVIDFDSEEKLKTIVNMCKGKKLYVLLPYFANGRDSNPCTISATPEQMDRAHWSAIERKGKNLHILEGNQKLYGGPDSSILDDARIGELFSSNQCLNKEFSWDAFSYRVLDNWNSSEAQDAKNTLNIIIDESARNSDSDRYHYKNGDSSYSLEKNLMEKVNLRGRALLVGEKGAVDTAVKKLNTPQQQSIPDNPDPAPKPQNDSDDPEPASE